MLPPASWMLCIGNLTDSPTSFDSNDFRWTGKNITSMAMPRYMSQLTDEEQATYKHTVSDSYHDKEGVFDGKVRIVFKMD